MRRDRGKAVNVDDDVHREVNPGLGVLQPRCGSPRPRPQSAGVRQSCSPTLSPSVREALPLDATSSSTPLFLPCLSITAAAAGADTPYPAAAASSPRCLTFSISNSTYLTPTITCILLLLLLLSFLDADLRQQLSSTVWLLLRSLALRHDRGWQEMTEKT